MFGVLADVAPEHVLAPVATDVDRAWSVLPDAGTRLRDRLETHPGERFDRWVDVVRDHAVLQRALHRDGRLDARPRGPRHATTDRHPPRRRLAGLARPRPRPADSGAGVASSLTRACDALAASPVPPTVQQDDLHDGNVLLDAGAPMPLAYRLVDWGDASISHPFGVFLILRISLATRGGVDPHGPELRRVEDAYLAGFADLAPVEELRERARPGGVRPRDRAAVHVAAGPGRRHRRGRGAAGSTSSPAGWTASSKTRSRGSDLSLSSPDPPLPVT